MKIRYSEIFGGTKGNSVTFQGEGKYTGIPTVWIRLFGCNFECGGFGQKNPRDSSTWLKDDIDFSKYNSMEELPVLKYGCDSAYSWDPNYKRLAHDNTEQEIAKLITDRLECGTFIHPYSKQHCHMAFTGGEPMLNQKAVVAIMNAFSDKPGFVTVETNGTQEIKQETYDCIKQFRGEWFWSVSPKLSISGEKFTDAIRPDVLKQYRNASDNGQLKYVVDGSDEVWDEVQRATDMFRLVGITWPVYIMPMGGTKEDQEDIQMRVVEGALKRGYNISARVHAWVFANIVGR